VLWRELTSERPVIISGSVNLPALNVYFGARPNAPEVNENLPRYARLPRTSGDTSPEALSCKDITR